MYVQLVVALKSTVVRKAARMVEQDAQRELGGARIAFEVSVRGKVAERLAKVLLDRLVEAKYATLDKLHHNCCEGWLGERGRGHFGIGREGEILFSVAQAVSLEVDDLAMMEQRHAGAGDMRGLNQAVHSRIDLRGCKVAPIRANNCGLLRSGRSCKHYKRESWNVQKSTQAEPP